MSIAFRRVWLLINVVLTAALVPALFSSGDGGSSTAVAAGAGAEPARELVVATAPPTSMPAPTTTTAAAPAPTPKVTEAPKPQATTTTTAKPTPRPTTTTTTAPKPPPPAPPASGSESGRATWYDYKPGICAHKTLPFGTVVTVNAVNGKSVQCTVGDRGPFVDGYVIDLHWQEFEQLAPRSTGRIDVTITW